MFVSTVLRVKCVPHVFVFVTTKHVAVCQISFFHQCLTWFWLHLVCVCIYVCLTSLSGYVVIMIRRVHKGHNLSVVVLILFFVFLSLGNYCPFFV